MAIYRTPRKIETYKLKAPALVLIPLFALAIQAYLPLYWSSARLLDLPLVVLIYYGLTRRSPIYAMLAGAIIGIAQDSLTGGAIGLFGSSKTVIGYVAHGLSSLLDTDGFRVRMIIIFFFYMFQTVLIYSLGTFVLGQSNYLYIVRSVFGGLVNAVIGVLLYRVLDQIRKPA